jgi:PAS domain S-box-containing protein
MTKHWSQTIGITPRQRAFRIAAIYVAVSAVWIWSSDRLVHVVFGGSGLETVISSIKGSAWVTLMGILLYLLVAHDFKAIQSSEERFRVIYEDNPSACFTVGGDGLTKSANKYGAGYFGYEPAELVGRPYLDQVYEADRPSFSAAFAQALLHPDEVVQWEYRKKARDGRILWIKESARAVTELSGEQVVLVVGTDVTERRTFVDALAASEERYRRLAEASPDVVFTADRDLKVDYVNDMGARLLRSTPDKILGRHVNELFPKEIAGRMTGSLKRVLESGKPEYIESNVIFPGAELWQGNWLVPLLTPSGEITGVLGVGRDISEAKRIDALKTDFLSMASHELRTPLTSIIGYCDLLRATDYEEHPELFERVLRSLGERGNHMKKLVNDLLEVSRIESGDFKLVLEASDVGDVVRRSVEALQVPEGLSLDVDVPGDMATVMVDPDRLAYAVDNLLSNAVKFSPGGGKISVRVRAEDDIEIAVSDEGVGIDPEELSNIFERFTQADMSSTRAFGGFGMGLHIVRTIAWAHGGRVDVESEPGKGSTFTLHIPIVSP